MAHRAYSNDFSRKKPVKTRFDAVWENRFNASMAMNEISSFNLQFFEKIAEDTTRMIKIPDEMSNAAKVMAKRGHDGYSEPMQIYATHHEELVKIIGSLRKHEEILDKTMIKQLEEYLTSKDRCKSAKNEIHTRSESLIESHKTLLDIIAKANIKPKSKSNQSPDTKGPMFSPIFSPIKQLKSPTVDLTRAQAQAEEATRELSKELCKNDTTEAINFNNILKQLSLKRQKTAQLTNHPGNDELFAKINKEIKELEIKLINADNLVKAASKVHVTSIIRLIEASRCDNIIESPPARPAVPQQPASPARPAVPQQPASPPARPASKSASNGGSQKQKKGGAVDAKQKGGKPELSGGSAKSRRSK
jgi:hypothetical protein